MNRTKEGQFLDVVVQVLEKEQTSLRRLCGKRTGLSSFTEGIASRCMEKELVYLVYKKLLGKSEFHKWTILSEDPYPDLRLRSDIMMTSEKVPASKYPSDIKGPWDCIEFSYYSFSGMEEDVDKLKKLKTTKTFQCGERYIVIFSWRDEDEGSGLQKSIEDADSFKNGSIEWTFGRRSIPKVWIPKYRIDDNSGKPMNRIFEIAFLKLTGKKRTS